ncbi:MAG TPA: hypothetical protein VFA10_12380 [Ktedonobacteraceae bacterium]|nr:hypothetical protein [Ktedonobacteraceae bacterium]
MKTLREKCTVVGTVFITSTEPDIAPSVYPPAEHAIHSVISGSADAMNTIPAAYDGRTVNG